MFFLIEGPNFELDPRTEEIHTVTSLFKSYLREIPDEILPTSDNELLAYKPQLLKHDEDLDPNLIPTQLLQDELTRLKFCNFALLHVLIRHFATVVKHSESNRMNLVNLAVILSPSLRIRKSVFIALVSKDDLLWKDLHPSTPKPPMDPTFASHGTHYYEQEERLCNDLIDAHLDDLYGQDVNEFDFYQPNFGEKPRSGSVDTQGGTTYTIEEETDCIHNLKAHSVKSLPTFRKISGYAPTVSSRSTNTNLSISTSVTTSILLEREFKDPFAQRSYHYTRSPSKPTSKNTSRTLFTRPSNPSTGTVSAPVTPSTVN